VADPWPVVPAPYVYNAVVERVIDGDTVVVAVDWGFFRYDNPIHVRLLGCNAAELGTPGGDAARDNLTGLLPAGTPLVLQTAKPDKYAPRWDAAVTYLVDGSPRDLVSDLIAAGWVAPWNGRGAAPVPPWPRPEGGIQ